MSILSQPQPPREIGRVRSPIDGSTVIVAVTDNRVILTCDGPLVWTPHTAAVISGLLSRGAFALTTSELPEHVAGYPIGTRHEPEHEQQDVNPRRSRDNKWWWLDSVGGRS